MSEIGFGTDNPPGHRPKHRPIRGCFAVLVAFAVVVGIGGFVYVEGVDAIHGWLSDRAVADYPGPGHGSVVVRVRDGDTATDIGASLQKANVVESVQAFTDAAKDDDRSRSIQVGYYRMRHEMSGRGALDRLLDPAAKISVGFTVVEGMRAKEILASIVAHTRFTAKQVAAAYADTLALGLPPYAKGDAEGYLYPATYPVTPGTTPASLLAAMTTRFKQEADSLDLVRTAAHMQVSPSDVVIIASLVQAEASRAVDMPKVARVIYNRLKIGMPLQLDSTLHYAIASRGVVSTSQQLRKLDTPYNTYKYTGLPPTPIGSPGEDALQAALHPAQGNWRYFVTVNLRTGETRFANTYAQFLIYRQQYFDYCKTSKAC